MKVNPNAIPLFPEFEENGPKSSPAKKIINKLKNFNASQKKAAPLATPPSAPPPEEQKPRSPAVRARAKKDAEKRGELMRYYERKKLALTMERKNFSKLIFILGNGKQKWYKGFGHTAVIFEHRVGPMIGSKAVARKDGDFNRTIHSKEGVVAVRYIDDLREKLLKIGCTIEDDKDNIYVFNLPWTVAQEQYNLYLRESEEMVERTNKILAPHLIMPELYTQMILLHRLIFYSAERMSKGAREMVGQEMEQNVRTMIKRYVVAAKTKQDAMAVLESLMIHLDDFNGNLAAINGLGVDEDRKIMEMAEKAEEVRKEILLQMKIVRAKEIEREHGDNPR
ncbi:hypothetical protein IJN73_02120 [Candidatus Saccharibacteria bacterium]|nr:hypothetical protein [Candidatus Saccharibacteria bacterium]